MLAVHAEPTHRAGAIHEASSLRAGDLSMADPTIEQRAELVAWCGQVSEDVHTRLDGTWPNDPLLTRCSIAFGRLFAEIDRLEREARASKSGEAAP